MEKKKHKPQPSTAASISAEEAQVQPSAEPVAVPVARTPGLLHVRHYVLLNIVFDAFCLLQLIIARIVIRDTRGMYFFFALLMIGFLLVSVFDFAYDRITHRRAVPIEQS